MLRFRVTHSEPKRVLLTWHGDKGETGRLEMVDADGDGSLGEHFTAGAFFDVHLHPEDAPLHAHAGDDSLDLGSAEEEADTTDDKDAEIAKLRAEVDALRTSVKDLATGKTDIQVAIEQSIPDADDPDRIAAATTKAIAEMTPPPPSAPIADEAPPHPLDAPDHDDKPEPDEHKGG